MNFSIVVPGGCNARCSFCFWDEQKISDEYLFNLINTLSNLPSGCALSLTGGEPTLSEHFDLILQTIKYYKHKFEKVILTTNGTKLDDYIKKIDGIVDHINISRHHYDDKIRKKIFGMNIISDEELKPTIQKCNEIGIDVTFNSVICGELKTKQDVVDFIEYAKSMGASAITFRKDYNEDSGLDVSKIEKHFEKYKSTYSYDCPVCRTKSQLINGLKVTWKSSSFEPSNDLKDIYEMIFQPNGKLTIDWKGEKEISFVEGRISKIDKKVNDFLKSKKKQTFITSDFSSCGGRSSFTSRNSGCGGSVSTRSYSGCGGSISTSNHSGCGG